MTDPNEMVCGPDRCSPAKTSSPSSAPEPAREMMVFSDFICPWCLIGKSRLDIALSLAGDAPITVRWMPFELNPSMPTEGMDRREYRSAKFGSWERSQALDAQVEQAAKADGLTFRHDLMERTPNTRDAHRLTWLADQHNAQDAVATTVLRAYFLDGLDIGRREILADIASEFGMDRASTLTWLQSDAGQREVQEGLEMGRTLGISGVPSVVANGEVLFSGAQDPRTMAVALFGNSRGKEH